MANHFNSDPCFFYRHAPPPEYLEYGPEHVLVIYRNFYGEIEWRRVYRRRYIMSPGIDLDIDMETDTGMDTGMTITLVIIIIIITLIMEMMKIIIIIVQIIIVMM